MQRLHQANSSELSCCAGILPANPLSTVLSDKRSYQSWYQRLEIADVENLRDNYRTSEKGPEDESPDKARHSGIVDTLGELRVPNPKGI